MADQFLVTLLINMAIAFMQFPDPYIKLERDIRSYKEILDKETIERVFADMKEKHGMR